MLACLAPVRLIEKLAGATRPISVDDDVAVIFSSGSEGDPKGVVLTHFNIDSNIEAIAQVFHILPTDRMLDVLPLFHSFGYLLLWLAGCRGHGPDLPCQPARGRLGRRARRALQGHGSVRHSDLSSTLHPPLSLPRSSARCGW